MSKDQYLEMMEQMGQDPDWEKCPLDWEDFPEIVLTCMNIFNSMGERIYPEIGYIGKDYTNFDFLLEHYGIKKHQKEFIFETILWLDSRAIEIAQKKLKAEYDKIKNKRG
jgi:hypothetical protein